MTPPILILGMDPARTLQVISIPLSPPAYEQSIKLIELIASHNYNQYQMNFFSSNPTVIQFHIFFLLIFNLLFGVYQFFWFCWHIRRVE